MDDARSKLQPWITAWSDGEGLTRAKALVDRFRALFPRQITNAQLAGLNSAVQVVPELGQVTAFAIHQASRAARAGRLEVKDYWDAVREMLEGLEYEAEQLAAQAGVIMPPVTGRRQRRKQTEEFAWLGLGLAREFVQHLVAHSLYIGREQRS